MSKPVVRLSADEADSLSKVLRNLLASRDLDGRKRRRIGLALQSVDRARARCKGRKVQLQEADVLRILRCFAEAGWTEDFWLASFG